MKRTLLTLALVAVATAAFPAGASAQNSVNSGWGTFAVAARDCPTPGNCPPGQITCERLAATQSVSAAQINGLDYMACSAGPGGQNWDNGVLGTLFAGTMFDLFTPRANGSLSGGFSIGACHPVGWRCKNIQYNFGNLPANGSPYWWWRADMTIVVPDAWHWYHAGPGCTLHADEEVASCSVGAQFVTHH